MAGAAAAGAWGACSRPSSAGANAPTFPATLGTLRGPGCRGTGAVSCSKAGPGSRRLRILRVFGCMNVSRPSLRPRRKPIWARGCPRAAVPSCSSHGTPDRLGEGQRQRCGLLLCSRQQCSQAKRTPRPAAGAGERGEHARTPRTPPESSARPCDRPGGTGWAPWGGRRRGHRRAGPCEPGLAARRAGGGGSAPSHGFNLLACMRTSGLSLHGRLWARVSPRDPCPTAARQPILRPTANPGCSQPLAVPR